MSHTISSKISRLGILALLAGSMASAATFGKVVSIGGHASDIALDEARGVLYIANFTSARIDVMSLGDNSISHSLSVPAYPGALSVSPDGHYLVVTHYATTAAGASLFQPGQNAVTVIDLANGNQKRTFGLSSGPVGVAFGIDGRAVILTQDTLLLFDPASGTTTPLDTVANVLSQPLPVEQPNVPTQIIAGSLTATADGRHIFGIGGTTPDTGTESHIMLFSYNVTNRVITANHALTAAPSLAPRAISVSRDGSYFMTGWAMIGCGFGFLGDCTADGPILAQVPGASSTLNYGSVAIRSSRNLIYGQIAQGVPASPSNTETTCLPSGICITITTPGTTAVTSTVPPNLMVMDADNLTVRERIQLRESLSGKSVLNADETVMYSISESGVTVFPFAELERAPRVVATQPDVVFRSNFCAGASVSQVLDIVDPSGNAVPFQICEAGTASCSLPAGVTLSQSAGVTPTKVTITIDKTAFGALIGTKEFKFDIRSGSAVNMPPPPSLGRLETYTANVRSRFRVLANNREPENRGAFINVSGELVEALADPARNRFYVLRLDTNEVLVFDGSSYSQIATLRTGNTPMSMAITLDRKYLLVGNDNSQLANRFDLDTLKAAPPILFPLGHYPRSIAVSGGAILAASRVAGPIHTIDIVDLNRSAGTTLPSLGAYKNDIHVSTKLTASPNGSSILVAMPDGRLMLYNANAGAFTIARKEGTSLKGAVAASSFGAYMVDHLLLNESLVPTATVLDSGDSSSGFAFVDQVGYSTAVSAAGRGYIKRVSSAGASPLPTMIVENPSVFTTDADLPFRTTIAPLADRSAIIALSTSGFTVLPWEYDAATVMPTLDRIVNAADFTKPVAPGGLVSIFGTGLSPMTLSSKDVPLPTVLADSCLTVNGIIVPVAFVSPTQINAQLPLFSSGNAELLLRTPGGKSDPLKFTILPAASIVFRSGTAGPATDIPTIVRDSNAGLVTVSNPIHPNDHITIYVTGMGQTFPEVAAGQPAPNEPLSQALLTPTVTLGGSPLFVDFAGLTPGLVGVGQINVTVPFKNVPTGFDIPLTITQAGFSTTIPVRVVN